VPGGHSVITPTQQYAFESTVYGCLPVWSVLSKSEGDRGLILVFFYSPHFQKKLLQNQGQSRAIHCSLFVLLASICVGAHRSRLPPNTPARPAPLVGRLSTYLSTSGHPGPKIFIQLLTSLLSSRMFPNLFHLPCKTGCFCGSFSCALCFFVEHSQ